MIDEIIELLKNYSNRFADEEYYIKLGETLMKYKEISQDELLGIECSNIEEAEKKFNSRGFDFTKAFYYAPDKKIYLLLDTLIDDTQKWGDYDLSQEEYYLFTNLVRSTYVFHELEHAIQEKGKPGLEGILIKDCPSVQEASAYVLSPREHFANLHAYLLALSIAEKMNLPKDIVNYFKECIHETLFNPYLYNRYDYERINKDGNEPIIEFFYKINTPVPIDLESINNLDFITRIIFEVGITEEEYENFSRLLRYRDIEPEIINERLNNDIFGKKR